MQQPPRRPNVIFVFPDQMRAQATGYAGDLNAVTPHLDRLAAQSVRFTNAVSGCPVCCPARASLITGQYPTTHGVFVNDVCLRDTGPSFAHAFKAGGYRTGYIGKWHLDGHGRSSFIPPQRRQGFEHWHARECNHDYWDALYFADTPEPRTWPGYEPEAQTRDAEQFIRAHATAGDRPFALVLSWGPPHSPYETAAEEYRRRFDPEGLVLRPNVPPDRADLARRHLAGYYAHINALDDCLGRLLETVDACGIADDTIVVFWSDHGDQLGSHGQNNKQQPYDESIRVPLLIRCPRRLAGRDDGRAIDAPINTPDLLPTLLGLCDLPVPAGVEGRNYAPCILDPSAPPPADAALIASYHPFGQWSRKQGGREYRGVRTERYTYVRDLSGPWLLFDNHADPYQLDNLVDKPQARSLRDDLDQRLWAMLWELGDEFLPGEEYIRRWGYPVDATGTVPYQA